jgi:hypothetical protein
MTAPSAFPDQNLMCLALDAAQFDRLTDFSRMGLS